MLEVFWTSSALRDRLKIFRYIAEDNPKAAQKIDLLIEEKVKFLLDFPLAAKQSLIPNVYELVIHKNYKIIYDLNATQLRILAVVHSAQKIP